MIQGFTQSIISAYINTEDNRIDTSVPSAQIRFLVKLINDTNGDVEYCYPTLPLGILPRYTKMVFSYAAVPDFYLGQINLLPAGHWKYEVYEVSWSGSLVSVEFGLAPATETDVILPGDNRTGVVQGIVTKGILNLTESKGTEQVQYTQHESPDSPNYVWYGTDIVLWNPADETSMIAWYKNKAGITLDGKGNVSEWEDSSSNTYNMLQSTANEMPSYTASTGGVVFDALQHLAAITSITLSTQFTIAFKIKANTYIGYILSDKATVSGGVRLKGIADVGVTDKFNAGVTLVTTTGNWQDAYVVITRNAANLVSMSVNGVLQTSAATLLGDVVFNILGQSFLVADNFDGSIFEIQVYDSTSQALTDNINERLSNL